MNKERKSNVKKTAVCGVLSALSVVLLWIAAVTDIFSVSAVVVCAVITMIIKIEAGTKWAWEYTLVTGVISLLLLTSKVTAFEFIVLGGIYPIIKADFEKINLSPIRWILKISFVDLMFLAEYMFCRLFFTAELENTLGLTIPAIIIVTVFAVVFDFALTAFISLYIVKLRKQLKLKSLF